jgi:hypothetical protein
MSNTATKQNIPTEHAEQVTLVAEFERTYPNVVIFAIPNGGLRNPVVAQKLKLEGVKKGVPDLFIPAWQTWVEMKRIKGGRLSTDQKRMKQHLESYGYTVLVCNGWQDAMQQCKAVFDQLQTVTKK